MLRTDPFRLDDLVVYAAAATARCAPTRKRWQSAIGASNRSTSHRHYQGCRTSPVTRTLELVEQLARGEGTTPWPIIADSIAVAIQASIRTADEGELRRRLEELTDREHTLEAEENRQTARGDDDEAAAAADIEESAAQLERAAIRRELARRKKRQA